MTRLALLALVLLQLACSVSAQPKRDYVDACKFHREAELTELSTTMRLTDCRNPRNLPCYIK